MASIKHLKRDLNYVMGDIIEAAYIHQMANPKADPKTIDEIVDEAVATYDEMIVKINDRSQENRGKHLQQLNRELEQKATGLIEKLNTL
ncbi:hypothetical protein [Mesonia maritima]|uniref:Inosine-uridine nucleoside N-ribohydrolase n=1 Tax=Mesonia maritima TaxID=1793873 RepID=A0ABU1K6D8_9FLAO|nr:hypothetical protein [Mesonia maritima]MDR6301164.1 inosine-uridine nucleoside N-ribohydrolase [Mesonia maritima]